MPQRTADESRTFAGDADIIVQAFGVADSRDLDQKSTCQLLDKHPPAEEKIAELVDALYRRLEQNWERRQPADRVPSKQNWRRERQLTLHEDNDSPEVVLERAIAKLADQSEPHSPLRNWFNQIPVASGLINSAGSRREAIDLLHHTDDTATFYELKWASNTPAFAAIEVLRYGLAFLFYWANREHLGPFDCELFQVRHVHLRVLAPQPYYAGYDQGWLVPGLNRGLQDLVAAKTRGELMMDFGFLSFPSDFKQEVAFERGEDVKAWLKRGPSAHQAFIKNLSALEPVWPQ